MSTRSASRRELELSVVGVLGSTPVVVDGLRAILSNWGIDSHRVENGADVLNRGLARYRLGILVVCVDGVVERPDSRVGDDAQTWSRLLRVPAVLFAGDEHLALTWLARCAASEFVAVALSLDDLRDVVTAYIDGLPRSLSRARPDRTVTVRAADATVMRSSLTGREREVLGCVARGLSGKEISVELGMSYNTVRTHMNHVLTKLGVRTRLAAAAQARRAGVLP